MSISQYPVEHFVVWDGYSFVIEQKADLGDLLIATLLSIFIALFLAKFFVDLLKRGN